MIRILDKSVADKIAAGEVVDRPLSIVKELLENAIDAGADSIIIEIKNGGKSYIRVTDNGRGIPSGEAALAFERHATSKITTDVDLERVKTLGFRGEALASVAAVSKCELLTKETSSKNGTRVLIAGSEITSIEPLGCPDGTTIIVTDLFYNTPARRKFIKTDAAEANLIIDFISKMAVAYPNIKIRLINNGNILFATQGKGDALNGILTVFGGEVGRELIPVSYEGAGLSLSGFVSLPHFGKSNKKMQIFFVNGRNISSKVMEKGILGAYADRTAPGRYPVCFLFLSIDPEKLDVNIHPNKREVRFDDESVIADFVENAIKEALTVGNAPPEIKKDNLFSMAPIETSVIPQLDIKNLLSTMRAEETFAEVNIKEETVTFAQKKFDISQLSVTGQVFYAYITAVDESALYLIDQHAAHERILYERLLTLYKNEEISSQLLLAPFVIYVPREVENISHCWTGALRNIGFEISEFGVNAYIIKAVPALMELFEAKGFIDAFLDNVSESTDFANPVDIEKIMSKACKGAVKANDSLAFEEMKELLMQLSRCENPYNCPHGRPTFIKLTKDEIERMFKRK